MKAQISKVLRNLGLIKVADRIRYYFHLARTRKSRNLFIEKYPKVVLPPPYFLYETFGLNYFSYYEDGRDTAEWLINYFSEYKKLENINILDWGCGPARIIRHLPSLVGSTCNCYGSDYNPQYIEWCTKNIPDVSFSTNRLEPPLLFSSEFFDIAYGISIFTHLSEEMHFQWFDELMRVLKPDGILFLTLQGAVFKEKLTESESCQFDEGKLVVRANTLEGHRTYGAFQPDDFVYKLVGKNKVLKHIPGAKNNGKPEQDVWIIQKVI